jgi:hypothetical protein
VRRTLKVGARRGVEMAAHRRAAELPEEQRHGHRATPIVSATMMFMATCARATTMTIPMLIAISPRAATLPRMRSTRSRDQRSIMLPAM